MGREGDLGREARLGGRRKGRMEGERKRRRKRKKKSYVGALSYFLFLCETQHVVIRFSFN